MVSGKERGQVRLLVVPEELLGDALDESFLDRHTLTTRAAVDADQALAIAEVWHPQLVLLRSRLGEAAISHVCRTLKGTAARPPPKIVLITDHIGDFLADAIDAACDVHLVSPVEQAQLLETIADLLAIRRRGAERVPLEVLVHTEGLVDAGAVDSALANSVTLDEDGMLLEANCQLRVGSRGRLEFFLPGSGERMTVSGLVRMAIDEVRLLYAVDFVDLAPQHRAEIRRFLEGHGVRA